MFKSKGKIVYNPRRSFKDDSSNKWWCVLEVNEDFSGYLRWHLERNWWMVDPVSVKRDYHRPPHYPHCSIIRGEKPSKNIEDWGKFYSNKIFEFDYSLELRASENYNKGGIEAPFFFVDIFFKEYADIREHFGLKMQEGFRKFRGHITFARVM